MSRAFLLVALVACGGIDMDIEDHVTIDQGAYGLLLKGCDTSGCSDQIGVGIGVTLELPPPAGTIHGSSLDATTSDAHGVYQFDIPAGHYQLCTVSCTPIEVPETGRVRYDWISGPGGGEWCDGRC
jgi:hypothetical protein